jgi:hypothetical protein
MAVGIVNHITLGYRFIFHPIGYPYRFVTRQTVVVVLVNQVLAGLFRMENDLSDVIVEDVAAVQ